MLGVSPVMLNMTLEMLNVESWSKTVESPLIIVCRTLEGLTQISWLLWMMSVGVVLGLKIAMFRQDYVIQQQKVKSLHLTFINIMATKYEHPVISILYLLSHATVRPLFGRVGIQMKSSLDCTKGTCTKNCWHSLNKGSQLQFYNSSGFFQVP